MASVGRIFGVARIGARTRLAVAGLGLAFAVLTGLVAGGRLTWIDQHAVDHLMPALEPGRPPNHSSRGLYLPFGSHTIWWAKLLDVWTYPCSVLVSALLLAVVLVVLRRRGQALAGLLWIAAWVVGNGIEVVGKWLISRPALYGTAPGARLQVPAFDQSFPSGHTIRCVVIAAAILSVSPRATRAVLLWMVLVPVCLVLSSAHTPSDILGGALIGLALVLIAKAIADPSVTV